MKPIFSIIIPCYNVEDYVDKAIHSCLNQSNITLNDFELIIINDGSTDNTYARIAQYSNYSNIRIINQSNSGLSITRNRGMDLATGEYILFLDGDDWFADDALDTLKKYIGKVDLIIFPMKYYFSEDDVRQVSLKLQENHIYDSQELLRETIGKSRYGACPSPIKCYKSSAIKDNKQTFIEGILHEDGPFFLETLHNIKSAIYIDKFIYVYRQNRCGSITTVARTWRNASGIFRGQEKIRLLYGKYNKDVNLYFLSTSVMQIIQPYNTEDDIRKVITYMSTKEFKRFMIVALLNSRFNLKTSLLSVFTILSPRLTRCIYDIFKKK